MKKFLEFITQAFEYIISIFQSVSTKVPPLSTQPPQTHRREFSVEVVRPDDLLILTLDFYNLKIKSNGGVPQLERIDPGNGFVVARFQPQSIVEQAFFEKDKGAPNPPDPPSLPIVDDPLIPPPVASRIAGPSQLVFRIYDTQLPIDFKLEALLQVMQESEPIVQPRILMPLAVPNVRELTDFGGHHSQYSFIEAPIRLILSPDAQSRWMHKLLPVMSADLKHTELWHTRLEGKHSTVSAVWSPDYQQDNPNPVPDDENPFRMSLHAENRHQLVRVTSDHTLDGAQPAPIEQLLLSSQGAWMNIHGKWGPTLPLVEWKHIMSAGRDQYVRVVKEGNLFWGGHRAVFIKITERKVNMVKAGELEGKPAAYLRQRYLIVVKEPTRIYSHRHFPFRSVTIKNLVTPNLDPPGKDHIPLPGSPLNPENAFWPQVQGHHFEFHIVATDWEGQAVEFLAPMAFIVKSISDVLDSMKPIVEEYNKRPADMVKRHRLMGGQKVAFAPYIKTGDTTLETNAMDINAMLSSGQPSFLPMMFTAEVDIPAVRQISGNQAITKIKLDETYTLASGIHFGNKAEVFAQVVDGQTPVNFSSDKTGGMVAPNFNIAGLSRYFGPIGANDITQFAQGDFKPAEMFQGIKLLGGIDLASIIRDMINATPDAAGTKIPQLQTIQTEVDGKEVSQTTYLWDVPNDFLVNAGPFQKNPDSQFFIKTILNTPLDGTSPHFEIQGGLKNFAVILLPKAKLVALHFTSADFISRPNQKVDFGIIFNKFEFLGDLAFVNKLSEVIPMDGFDDPPFLDLMPPPDAGVQVGFTQGIPTVGIGIFTLQNISFGAKFFLPFIGKPANLRLNFCERHQPFILTVSLFGGGGFFAIDIGFEGVQQLEAALEFGAAIALNLGVASGAACVMGGVYYRSTGSAFELSAYFRAAGALSVLGIITVSVELYIALTFASKGSGAHGGMLWGQASITVKIKIAFFSMSVSVGIEREFAGSDPIFSETVSPANWLDYCESFADYPA
jgi:hypothetical protein